MSRFWKLTQFAIGMLAGCLVGETLLAQDAEKKYSDERYDFSVTVSPPWKEARLLDYAVPGVARAAYSGADAASIVFFIQEPGRPFEPRFLVDESAKAIEKSLGAKIREKDVRTVANKQAMWLVVEGKGNGGAIDGKGAVNTTQHWVAIPRKTDVIVALLTTPADKFDENEKTFLNAVKTMVVGGSQTTAQAESK